MGYRGYSSDVAMSIRELENKYRNNHCRYSSEKILEIAELFEKYNKTEDSNKAAYYIDKLRFHVNYIDKPDSSTNIEKIMDGLNKVHYGHEKTKKALRNALVGAQLKGNNNSSSRMNIIITGAPGVGKTSIVEKLSELLSRNFVRLPVSGQNDDSYIVGTPSYVSGGKMGELTSQLIKSGSNPLVMIDEVEKAPGLFNTLIHILDSDEYFERYIQGYIDKRNWIIVMTCNSVDVLPRALRDRALIIDVSPYSNDQKVEITKNCVVPELLNELNLNGYVTFDDCAIEMIADKYVLGTSIRDVKRTIKSVMIDAVIENDNENKEICINESMVKHFLGATPISLNVFREEEKVGVAKILGVLSGYGIGNILEVQVAHTPYMQKPVITGLPEEMVIESINNAQAILSNLFGKTVEKMIDKMSVCYAPVSIKKDGSSGGLSTVMAICSCILNQAIPNNVAFTGEVSLLGDVHPVGGDMAKLIACFDSTVISKVYIPEENYRVLSEENKVDQFSNKLQIVPVKTVYEVLNEIFDLPRNKEKWSLERKTING